MAPENRTLEERLESPEIGEETSLIVRFSDSDTGIRNSIEEIGGTVREISDDQWKVTINEERLSNLVEIEGVENIEVEIHGGPLRSGRNSHLAMIQ